MAPSTAGSAGAGSLACDPAGETVSSAAGSPVGAVEAVEVGLGDGFGSTAARVIDTAGADAAGAAAGAGGCLAGGVDEAVGTVALAGAEAGFVAAAGRISRKSCVT